MARVARVSAETNMFHVIVQGIAKEEIFLKDEFKLNYLGNIKKFKDEDGVKVLAYCIMPNHCHMLVQVPNVDRMAHFMRCVNTRFASYYNLKNDRVGYVFRDRYKSQAIFDVKYLTNCLVYIHNNPLKAAIVSNLSDYRFSSFMDYMYGNGLVDFDTAKEYFDPSKENVLAMTEECKTLEGCPEWIDAKEDKRNVEDKAFEIISSYGIPLKMLRFDKDLMRDCATKLNNAGMTMVQIARLFGVDVSAISRLIRTK